MLIDALIQAILFSIIPFAWWMITARKEVSFFQWIGLKIPVIQNRKLYILACIGLIAFSVLFSYIVPPLVDADVTATSQFKDQGIKALLPALVFAFLQTGFSEELFFRGFIGKRLINQFNFAMGNALQGLIFGLVHGLMFFSSAGITGAIMITINTSLLGWLMGYINEKLSEGSILPSWLLHGTMNTLASLFVMF